MPVRKIGPRYGSVRGKVGNKHALGTMPVESTLERDYLIILRFDLGIEIESYETQPVRIEYLDPSGKLRSYIPDVSVVFAPQAQRKPLIAEIKPRELLRKHWLEWKVKFKAAHAHARERGSRFCILTEKDIRTPYLDNARFLQRSKDRKVDQEVANTMLKLLEQARERVDTPRTLLDALTADQWEQATIRPVLYHLIAWRRVATNLAEPFTDESRIWLAEEE